MTLEHILSHGMPNKNAVKLLEDSDPMLLKKMPAFDFDKSNIEVRKQIAETMYELMIENNGFGLAANQIGFEFRAFSMIMNKKPMMFFNPIISELTDSTIKMNEGCLSYPSLYLSISRPTGCRLNYQDIDGKRCTVMLSGIEARCAMHELDHLNGIMFTSKVSKLQLKMKLKKLSKSQK